MDVRLTAEQQQLRDAAAKLADDLGPGSVAELADNARIIRLDRQIAATGWRSLRSDRASGVEVAIVAEEFGRGLVDAPFLGPVLADDLIRHVGGDAAGSTIALNGQAIDARGFQRALRLDGTTVAVTDVGAVRESEPASGAQPARPAIHGEAELGVHPVRPSAEADAHHRQGGQGAGHAHGHAALCDHACGHGRDGDQQ